MVNKMFNPLVIVFWGMSSNIKATVIPINERSIIATKGNTYFLLYFDSRTGNEKNAIAPRQPGKPRILCGIIPADLLVK